MKRTMKSAAAMLSLLFAALCMGGCFDAPDAGDAPIVNIASAAPTAAPTEAPTETPTEAALVVDTCILKEADDKMLNTYTLLAVNPDAPFTDADGNPVSDVAVNTAGADALIHWLLTREALDMAGDYGVAEYGEHLFYVKDDAPVYTGDIAPATEETKQSILAHCRKNIAKYAMPYDIEFRENLPTTLVGKVAYRVLEDEELKKIS